MKWTQELRKKGYATTGRAQRRNFPENLRRPTQSRMRMEYMNFYGTVPMFLRVVAPETPETIDGRTPNLTYFFVASLNLEDEIHFKGGRLVTSQNSKFWKVILNR